MGTPHVVPGQTTHAQHLDPLFLSRRHEWSNPCPTEAPRVQQIPRPTIVIFFSPLFYFHAPTHNKQPFATHNERHTTQKNKSHHVCTGSMPQSSARDRERPPHLSYIKCPIQVDHTNITSRQIRLVTAPPHLRRENINQSCHMHTKRFYSMYISFHAHDPLSICSATPLFVPSFLPFTLASSNIPSNIPQTRLHAPRLKHEDVGVLVAEQVQQGDSIPAPIPNDQAA